MLTVLLFSLLLSSSATETQDPTEYAGAIEKVEAMVTEAFASDPLGSVTMGIVAGDHLVWSKSWGYSDVENKVKATPDSVYRIGSISKQFTGLMLLQLEEQGRVQFDDKVVQYFPPLRKVKDPFSAADSITLLQLATMTSGLAREPDNLPLFLIGPVSEWEKVVISAMPKTSFHHNPSDNQFLYSNIGYAILGASLEGAVDTPFTEYVTDHIFEPLGMKHTAFEPNSQIEQLIAKGYVRKTKLLSKGRQLDGRTPEEQHLGRGYKVPNGAMYTTIADLAKFLSFELGYGPETVLSKSKMENHFNRVRSESGEVISPYGIGFYVLPREDYIAYGHGGGVAGYTAAAYFDRESGFGVIGFRNVQGGPINIKEVCLRSLDILVESGR